MNMLTTSIQNNLIQIGTVKIVVLQRLHVWKLAGKALRIVVTYLVNLPRGLA